MATADRPLSYTIDRARRLVTILYHRQPTFADWAATMRAILADPRFEPGFRFLSDRRTVPEPPTAAYIRQVSAFLIDHAAQLRNSRLAMVVSNPATYGMARMSEPKIEPAGLEAASFFDLPAALHWLETGGTPQPGGFDGS